MVAPLHWETVAKCVLLSEKSYFDKTSNASFKIIVSPKAVTTAMLLITPTSWKEISMFSEIDILFAKPHFFEVCKIGCSWTICTLRSYNSHVSFSSVLSTIGAPSRFFLRHSYLDIKVFEPYLGHTFQLWLWVIREQAAELLDIIELRPVLILLFCRTIASVTIT